MVSFKAVKLKFSSKSLLIAVLVLAVLSVALIINRERTEPKGEPQRYKISSNEYPRFTEAFFDPFEFKPGQEQTILVKIENPTPIDKVTATIITDNKKENFQLKLASGSATKGTWWGSWKIKDTINHTYRETFKAVSGSEESKIELFFK